MPKFLHLYGFMIHVALYLLIQMLFQNWNVAVSKDIIYIQMKLLESPADYKMKLW